jgi:hypothetical protein
MDRAWFRKLYRVLLVPVVIAVWASGCGDDDTAVASCDYEGKRHEAGDMFPAGDGCNTCTCSPTGVVICGMFDCDRACEFEGQGYAAGDRFTLGEDCDDCTCNEDGTIECAGADPEDCVGCTYLGVSYGSGDSFPAEDGCNQCSCDSRGGVVCTERGCGSCAYAGQVYRPGQTFRAVDGCNECTCTTNLSVACSDKLCAYCEYAGQRYSVGEEFLGEDGCSRCTCGQNGGLSCEDSECPEGCRYGASWFEPGESVVCPDGCGTCECTQEHFWERPPVMCQVRYADLCVGGPGPSRIEGTLLYLDGQSLAVEADERMCPSSYVLCFNEVVGAGGFQAPVVDLWLVPIEEQSCDEQVGQFAFDLSTIRDYFWQRMSLSSARVTLQMSGDTLVYGY